MELLKTLLPKIRYFFNILFPFEDYVYILQLDNYSSSRFLQQLFNPLYLKILKRNFQKRENLDYTFRAIFTLIFSWFFYLLLIVLIILFSEGFFTSLLLFFTIFLLPSIIVFITNIFANILRVLYILDTKKAKNLIKKRENLKIIAITGSYGKTTTKEILFEFLRHTYKTQYVQENINTAIGIARWVNNNLKDDTEVLIVEMGAYKRGEILSSVGITPPNYALITELGDQHLDRFKTFSNLVCAKLEIFSINDSHKYILKNVYAKIEKEEEFRNLNIIDEKKICYKKYIENLDGKTTHLGNLILALKVAIDLEVSEEFLLDSITKLKTPNRRNNRLKLSGFTVIDNSYNISLNTAKKSISFATNFAKSKNQQLIVITGGIPEAGYKFKEVNRELGEILSKQSHSTIILNTVFSRFIKEGFQEEKNYLIKGSMQSALNHIFSNYATGEYVILMLPELSDLSY